MATSTICYTPRKGRILRLIRVDDCGVPVTGTGAATIVMNGFTQVAQTANYETGETYFSRRADGEPCVNEKDRDALTRLELTMDFCVIDPGLLANTVTARLLTYSESPTGTGFAVAEGISDKRFSLEIWQNVTGRGACDPATGQTRYVYNAWPNLGNARIGDYNIALEPSVLQIIAESEAVSPLWTVGNSWLGAGAVQTIPDHWFQNLTTVPPPTAACGIQ